MSILGGYDELNSQVFLQREFRRYVQDQVIEMLISERIANPNIFYQFTCLCKMNIKMYVLFGQHSSCCDLIGCIRMSRGVVALGVEY